MTDRPQNNYNPGGTNPTPTLEDLFPTAERRGFLFDNAKRATPDKKYGSIKELMDASRDWRETRAKELYDYAMNNTIDGGINMNSPYAFTAGNMAPTQVQQPSFGGTNPMTGGAPINGGNPFAAAAQRVGMSDFNQPAFAMQTGQANALRGSNK